MPTIQYLTTIEFDYGVVARIAEFAGALGIKRPLVVTDPGLAESEAVARVKGAFTPAATVFDLTPENPDEAGVLLATQLYKEAQCDGLIAVGGGSPIDLAKAVSLLATHPGPLEQYAVIQGGLPKITRDVAPLIAVPTTAGTGSEVGRAALITLKDGRKLGFISPHMIPKIAVCDPELTFSLPRRLTAATGMDALTHCVETFLSPRVNPPADAIAMDGAQRAATWIRTAFDEPDNREARWNMMMASLQGGLTFQKGLGAVHSMSHPLGGLTAPRLHHGTLNAVILPAVLRFNRTAAEPKIEALERAIGCKGSLATYIEALNADLNLPANLSAMGVTTTVVPRMVEGAMKDHSTATNPRPLTREDFRLLFEETLG